MTYYIDTYNFKIKNIKMGVLWENQNPTSSAGMPANTPINLLSDDYDVLVWFFAYSYFYADKTIISTSCLKGFSTQLNFIGYANAAILRRNVTYINDKKYQVSAALGSNESNAGSIYVIPVKVVGIKYSN